MGSFRDGLFLTLWDIEPIKVWLFFDGWKKTLIFSIKSSSFLAHNISALNNNLIFISSGSGTLFEEDPKENDENNFRILSSEQIEKIVNYEYNVCSKEDVVLSCLRQSTEPLGKLLKTDKL